MAGGLAILAFCTAVLDWYVVWTGKRQWRKFTKPLPLALLILVIGIMRPGYPFPIYLFSLGLLFGLVGDILLLFQGRTFFVLGLVAFLIGHLFYIVGFNVEMVRSSIWTILLLVPVGVALGIFLQRIMPYVKKKLRIAVWAYVLVLVTMLYSTLLTSLRSDWQITGIILAIIGGTFFVASDTMLAVDRFVKPKYGVWVMVTYHLAQMAIAAAVLIQYS
jgi:uncharacterized membrane protein YhhN